MPPTPPKASWSRTCSLIRPTIPPAPSGPSRAAPCPAVCRPSLPPAASRAASRAAGRRSRTWACPGSGGAAGRAGLVHGPEQSLQVAGEVAGGDPQMMVAGAQGACRLGCQGGASSAGVPFSRSKDTVTVSTAGRPLPPGIGQVDDGEAAMAEPDLAVRVAPLALAVGSPGRHGIRDGGQLRPGHPGGDGVVGEDGGYPAHGCPSRPRSGPPLIRARPRPAGRRSSGSSAPAPPAA